MIAIAVVGPDKGIGYCGHLLYQIPDDLRRFKKLTLGGTVIMGRKTFESLPDRKPLPGRTNIVLTRNTNFFADGIIIKHGIEEILEAEFVEPISVIGGETVYRLLLPFCDQLHLTVVSTPRVPADTFFPDFEKDNAWEILRKSPQYSDEVHSWQFIDYIRTAPSGI